MLLSPTYCLAWPYGTAAGVAETTLAGAASEAFIRWLYCQYAHRTAVGWVYRFAAQSLVCYVNHSLLVQLCLFPCFRGFHDSLTTEQLLMESIKVTCNVVDYIRQVNAVNGGIL